MSSSASKQIPEVPIRDEECPDALGGGTAAAEAPSGDEVGESESKQQQCPQCQQRHYDRMSWPAFVACVATVLFAICAAVLLVIYVSPLQFNKY